MSDLESKVKNLPDTYRGPEKWNNAYNEASVWGSITSFPALIYTFKPAYDLVKNNIDRAGNLDKTKINYDTLGKTLLRRSFISASVMTAISLVAGYFGYKKAETAEKDYGNALSVVKDLTLENEKLKVEAKWAERVQERRQEATKELSHGK